LKNLKVGDRVALLATGGTAMFFAVIKEIQKSWYVLDIGEPNFADLKISTNKVSRKTKKLKGTNQAFDRTMCLESDPVVKEMLHAIKVSKLWLSFAEEEFSMKEKEALIELAQKLIAKRK